jgi:predicted transcriptional regulator
MYSIDAARTMTAQKANKHIGCDKQKAVGEAIFKAACRGENSVVYISEERNAGEISPYLSKLRAEGYKAEITGRNNEGYFVLYIEW